MQSLREMTQKTIFRLISQILLNPLIVNLFNFNFNHKLV